MHEDMNSKTCAKSVSTKFCGKQPEILCSQTTSQPKQNCTFLAEWSPILEAYLNCLYLRCEYSLQHQLSNTVSSLHLVRFLGEVEQNHTHIASVIAIYYASCKKRDTAEFRTSWFWP